jgi:peroxiredoxin
LQENADKYKELNIPILIIIGQKRESVKKWLNEHPMPFPFLVDEDREVTKAFNVYHPFGIAAYKIAYPSLFLISEKGKIVYSYVGKDQKDRPTENETYTQVHRLLAKTITE